MDKNYDRQNRFKVIFRVKSIVHFACSALLFLTLLLSVGCSDSDDFVQTHKGQFLDAPVRGLDYVSGGQSGVTDENGIFIFERTKNITIKLGNIQIGGTVPVVSGLEVGEFLPDVWIFTPRYLVPDAINNRDYRVTNIIRFLQTLDNDYDFYDGVDNAANGIYIDDNVRKSAASSSLSLDFNLQEAEFEKAAENVIATLTGGYRRLIPALSAQHHFISQLIQKEVDSAITDYKTPGVTMSIETPSPCDKGDLECIESGVMEGKIRYNSDSHAYIWDFVAGYSDLENKIPMTIDTRFRIGSLTKSFVAMTILKLVEEGTFNLDYNHLLKDHDYLPEPVKSTFITNFDIPSPNGKNYADAITIASIMNHSAGISNFYRIPSEFFLANLFEPEKQWNVIELVDSELQKGPLYYPGEGMTYSNTGYSILGLLIEHVTGQPWEEVIRERIIRPFGLDDIIVPETGESLITGPYTSEPDNTSKYAYGYMSLYGATGGIYGKESDPLTKRDVQDPSSTNSAGNMIGTAPALRSWIKLIANTGNENGLFGSNFDWLHNNTLYSKIFFPLNPILNVGANVYHYNNPNEPNNSRYIISGNLSGYDVNATYDIKNRVAVGACGNRTYDETSMPHYSGPDIWSFDDSHSVQIKDVLVFKTLDILTR